MPTYVHVKDEDGVHLFMTKKEYARIKKKSYKRFKQQYSSPPFSRKHKTSR